MAVDNESERRAAPNMLPFVIPPVPDGTISANDRKQMSYLYSGIPPGEGPAATPQPVFGFNDNLASTVFGGLVVR